MRIDTPEQLPPNPFYSCPESMTAIGEPITDRSGRKIQVLRFGESTVVNTDDCVFNAISDGVMDAYASELGMPRDATVLKVVARYANGESLGSIIDFDRFQ